jgi:polyisoprenyl-teichoic acid--peptidoglycan teichoic acid transferase
MLVTRTGLFRRALQALGLLMLTVSLTGLTALYYVGHRWSGRRSFAPVQQTREFMDVAFHPDALFPGETRLNILCLGLDRDWTDTDLPSSTRSRTDTMIAASLDLLSQRVTALSIPRDMRVEIPEHGFSKINDAYPLGGMDSVMETVNQFLGIRMNYYVLVKLGAVRRIVDAIGGITIDVEKKMDYDDRWGQLHIHLKRGVQHLNGDQAEGYMRFRHDAESDFGRMRRQQQALRAVLVKLQSPAVAVRVPQLIDLFSRNIETNLTREQILGLARMFHQVRPEDVVSDSLPGRGRMLDGISYLEPEEGPQKTLVDWLLRGDETAGNRLTTVRVLNGCDDRQTTRRVVRQLTERQFDAVYGGRARQTEPVTRIEGHGRHPDAGQRILTALPGGNLHWTPGKEESMATVIVGQDQAARVRMSQAEK